MSYFDSPQDITNIDCYIKVETDLPHPPLLRQGSSEKFMENIEVKTEVPRKETIEVSPSPDRPKILQSDLHNCPKHLIKLIIHCIGLGKKTSQQVAKQFTGCKKQVNENIKGLLGILQLIRRNKIRSFSKQLLKIVFQNYAQNISRLKLLQTPMIKKVFQHSNLPEMCQAKDILRAYVIDALQTKKNTYNDRSKLQKKQINDRYLDLFLQQIKQGRIKQRINKQDKMKILDVDN